jgi:hypothetical protein
VKANVRRRGFARLKPQALLQVLRNDAKADPHDKYLVLGNALNWTTNVGYPGYATAAIDEAFNTLVLCADPGFTTESGESGPNSPLRFSSRRGPSGRTTHRCAERQQAPQRRTAGSEPIQGPSSGGLNASMFAFRRLTNLCVSLSRLAQVPFCQCVTGGRTAAGSRP